MFDEWNEKLAESAAYGRLHEVKEAVRRGADVNYCAENGFSPLHFAACHGYIEVAEYLLSSGANVDGESAQHETPLCLAVKNADIQMIRVLLRFGADPNWSYSPINLAIRVHGRNSEVADALSRRNSESGAAKSYGPPMTKPMPSPAPSF